MGKWTPERNDVVWGGDTPRCVSADKYNDATEIVTRHNSDIVALTARAEAAEAERDELRRRIDAVLAMMDPGKRPEPEEYEGYDQLFRERLCRWKDTVKRYERAKDIAEVRDHE